MPKNWAIDICCCIIVSTGETCPWNEVVVRVMYIRYRIPYCKFHVFVGMTLIRRSIHGDCWKKKPSSPGGTSQTTKAASTLPAVLGLSASPSLSKLGNSCYKTLATLFLHWPCLLQGGRSPKTSPRSSEGRQKRAFHVHPVLGQQPPNPSYFRPPQALPIHLPPTASSEQTPSKQAGEPPGQPRRPQQLTDPLCPPWVLPHCWHQHTAKQWQDWVKKAKPALLAGGKTRST